MSIVTATLECPNRSWTIFGWMFCREQAAGVAMAKSVQPTFAPRFFMNLVMAGVRLRGWIGWPCAFCYHMGVIGLPDARP